ncbi:hypothetical protein SAMN04489729_4659 [Amycolatopsis lurida]|uniref:PPE family domain-containing protein n=1 Tax=Amycolatopsis lurida NRRL 2430 TaxID=1460371 RepID=A0A2P2FWS2_AMYLU|nr:hypothetical protein [Amycolatopsis lurida]KFU81164.1 hypothetical protein BB31_12345 [Amycolatopsis lurida NRRL 2430]SED54878.1 hypothetical protein SAMN04489729_4659 [Amycolatopsis lurida]
MNTKTPNLSEKQVSDLSPAARDAYFQQKAEEGVDPSDGWLFGAVNRFIASGKAHQQSQEVGDKNVDQLTKNKDVQYVEGLEPSNADYQGYDHEKLEQFVNSNLNVEQVADVSTAYHEIHKAFDSFAKTMDQAVTASQGTWEGDAAGNAQGYFKSLSKWSETNSQNAKLASETIYDQGTAASTVKNTMPKPIPFNWKEEVGGWMTSNPFNLGENIDKSIQKQKDSQEAHTQAASAMHSYDKALYDAASKQPAFAEPPKFGVGGGGDISGDRHLRYDLPPGSNNPGPGNPGNTYIPPGSRGGGSGGGGGGGGGYGTPNLPGPGSSTGSGSIPSGTTPSGFQNTPAPISTPGPNNNTAMPMGPMPMAPPMMGGGMGDSDYNSRTGRGGGGGSGFGPGSGAGGSTPGSGSASGAARPGGIGAAEAAAGRGMGGLGGGAAGRGGPGMGGGMGGRGQQADGDEDTEHQRPTYLVEGDPDEVFGTDMRTAPPVIGE